MIPHKNERNLRERGLSFELVTEFEFETALIVPDARQNYGEVRFRALGYIRERLHALVYTLPEDKLRVISLRRANVREISEYEKTTESGEG